MGDEKWGPSDSGDQETPDEKSGGSGSTDHETSSIHYTDWNESGRSSWDEKSGEVSGQHTTDTDTEGDDQD